MSRILRGALVVAAATVIGALGFAGSASAHVSVGASGTATQGGYTRIAFRVPTESDTASTTKVEVHLPTDQPVSSVSVMPVPGWTAQVQKHKLDKPVKSDDGEITEAVSVITWTASADAAVKPGQFQEFPVSLGPLPHTDKLVFKALQTYSDGNVVRWIDEPAADGKEPQHPAPTLKLAKVDSAAGDAQAPAKSGDAAGTAKSGAGQGHDGVAIGLGTAGLVAGLTGLVLGALAFARTRRAA
ncbi:MAG TPA: YcnI family protein [Planosporangium sp.]|jgi:uncharacterized protein YcnI|nr:YcnI family protein [Planosporangium sp.]